MLADRAPELGLLKTTSTNTMIAIKFNYRNTKYCDSGSAKDITFILFKLM